MNRIPLIALPVLTLIILVAWPCEVFANGGPFVVRYPNGDPAARGIFARLDPNLKPGREERLRVVKEDLNVFLLQDPEELRRSAVPRPRPAARPGEIRTVPSEPQPTPPLALVIAEYTIENPTGEDIEVDFGFPILRGIYLNPYSMGPQPDVQDRLDQQHVRVDMISNSAIYGIIRQLSREAIGKAIAGDAELARLVAQVQSAGYLRQRAREAVRRAAGEDPAVATAIKADPTLARLMGVGSDADDPDREAARRALLDYMMHTKKWDRADAQRFVEYAGLDFAGLAAFTPVRSFGYGMTWTRYEDLNQLTYAHLGPLSAIGDQKATQFLAGLAAKFDPQVSATYEAIFTAWGGDVRERSLDLATGAVRPREIVVDATRQPMPYDSAENDPTIYARVDYFDENANISPGEKESCRAILKDLPVIFTFAPMNLLHYQVKFPANETKTLTVKYRQYAYADTRDPASYQLAYVVHPASLWKEFGPINLQVALPEDLPVKASVELSSDGARDMQMPDDPPHSDASKTQRLAVHRTTLKDKTGELFIAIDAAAWKKYASARLRQPGHADASAPVAPPPVPAVVPVGSPVLAPAPATPGIRSDAEARRSEAEARRREATERRMRAVPAGG
jgi:hypothetical protein